MIEYLQKPLLRIPSSASLKTKCVYGSLRLMIAWIFFCFISSAYGQQEVLLRGEITNDSIEKSFVHVINLTTQKGTVTSTGGKFALPVRLGDSIYVSAIQFKPQTLRIDAAIYAKKRVYIKLTEQNTVLDEIRVSDSPLSGRLSDDASIPKVEKPFDPRDAGFPVYTGPRLTLEERRLYTATHSANGILSVDAMVNAITGKTKRLKKYVRLSNMQRRVTRARNFINDSTYIKILGIPPKYIDDFARYTYENNESLLFLVEQNDPIRVMDSLLIKAERYKTFKGL